MTGGDSGCGSFLSTVLSTLEVFSEWQVELKIMEVESRTTHSTQKAEVTRNRSTPEKGIQKELTVKMLKFRQIQMKAGCPAHNTNPYIYVCAFHGYTHTNTPVFLYRYYSMSTQDYV